MIDAPLMDFHLVAPSSLGGGFAGNALSLVNAACGIDAQYADVWRDSAGGRTAGAPSRDASMPG